jgi:hypothetical protein
VGCLVLEAGNNQIPRSATSDLQSGIRALLYFSLDLEAHVLFYFGKVPAGAFVDDGIINEAGGRTAKTANLNNISGYVNGLLSRTLFLQDLALTAFSF